MQEEVSGYKKSEETLRGIITTEKNLRETCEKQLKDTRSELEREKDLNSVTCKSLAELKNQLEIAKNEQAEATKKIETVQRTIDTKNKKAEELYKHHKETIYLFCTVEGTDSDKRKKVLETFEAEFEELAASDITVK
jgi:chromosome segregation ATPase